MHQAPLHREEHGQQGQSGHALEHHGREAGLVLIRHPTAQEVAYDHAQAGHGHVERQQRGRQSALVDQCRRYVTVPSQDASVAKHRGKDNEPRVEMAQKAELSLVARAGKGVEVGHESGHQQQISQTAHRDHREGQSPREGSREQRGHGISQKVGKRHSGAHDSHGTRLVALIGQPIRHNGSHAIIGAMGQAADEAGRQQPHIALRRDREQRAYEDKRHQAQEDVFGAQLMKDYEKRGSYANAQGVDGDGVSRHGNGDVQVAGQIGQDSLNNKFGHTQQECSYGKHQQAAQSFYQHLSSVVMCVLRRWRLPAPPLS